MRWYALLTALVMSVAAVLVVPAPLRHEPFWGSPMRHEPFWGSPMRHEPLRGVRLAPTFAGEGAARLVAGRRLRETRVVFVGGPPSWTPVRREPLAGGAARAVFRPPLDGVLRVTRRFDAPPRPWLPGHRGVDLAGAPGAVVRAAGPGTVVFAGLVVGRPVVSVDHPGGLRTTYEPVVPSVTRGARVDAGDPIGTLAAGHEGCPVAACLHWGLRRGEAYFDPLLALGFRVRLLPV